MPSRRVAPFDALTDEELNRCGVTISALTRIGRVATVPSGFVVSDQVFHEFRSDEKDVSERVIPWTTELEIAKAYDRLGSTVVNVMPSPSYASEISGSYVSDKASLVREIRKTMVEFLSEEEADNRKGLEVPVFTLAFLVQGIPEHSASGSIDTTEEGSYAVRSVLGLPVDLSSSDRMLIDSEGSLSDRTILSQEKKWVAADEGMREVDVERELRRELKVPIDLLKKLSSLGERLTRKIGPGLFHWFLKDRIFIVWNVALADEPSDPAPEPKEDEVEVQTEIPEGGTSIFLLTETPPETVQETEIRGLFLLPSEGATLVADDLIKLSKELGPRPLVVLAGDKSIESLTGARRSGGDNIWPMFGTAMLHSDELTKSATERGLTRSENLKFWLEADTPTSLLLLKNLAGDFDGVFIPVDHLVDKMEGPEDRRFTMALSALDATVNETRKHGLAVAMGTSNRERLTELWRYCSEKGVDILAVDGKLIEEALSLRRA